MAIIICPECGKRISDQANICVHCGYPSPIAHLKQFDSPHSVETKSDLRILLGGIKRRFTEIYSQIKQLFYAIEWNRNYIVGFAVAIVVLVIMGVFVLAPWLQQIEQSLYQRRTYAFLSELQSAMDSYVDNNSFRLSLLLMSNTDNGWKPLHMGLAARIGDELNSLHPPAQFRGTHEKLKKAFKLLNDYAYDQNYFTGSRDTYIEIERNRLFAFNRLMRELRMELADPVAK